MKRIIKVVLSGVFALGILIMAGCGDIQMDLQKAVEKGDAKKVKQLINNGADVNYNGKNSNVYSLLSIAIRGDDITTFQALVDAGIKADTANKSMSRFMSDCGHQKHNLEKIKLMQKIGFDINSRRDDIELTVLMTSVKTPATIKYILDNGGKVNLKDITGATALMKAAKGGVLKSVKLLIQNGANPKLKDRKGRNAFDYAFKKRKRWIFSTKKYFSVLEYLYSKGAFSENQNTVEQYKKDLAKIAEDKRKAEEKYKATRSIIIYKFIKYDPVKKTALIELENKTNKTIMTYSGTAQFLRSGKIIYMCGASDTDPNTVAFRPHQKSQWHISNSTMGFFPNANVDLAKEAKNLKYEFVMSRVTFKDGSKQTFK